MTLRAVSPKAEEFFRDEAGGMRWQRVPPTEKRGRVQTSTITVAVLPEPSFEQVRIDERDLEYRTCRGSGPGGQNRNKLETAVQLTHKPTGLSVRCETERSQHQNKQAALALLRAKLWQSQQQRSADLRSADRRHQIGSGERGDKRRTVALQRDQVVDHQTGRTWKAREYLRGEW